MTRKDKLPAVGATGARPARVTISGSFTKHWKEIHSVVEQFRELNAEVMSPTNGPPVREEDGFVYLREDVGSPDTLERRHLQAIRKSDLLYIVNPNGYLGSSVALEIGYALAWRTAMWSLEAFKDTPHRLLVEHGAVAQALNSVSGQIGAENVPPAGDLDELQAYIGEIAKVRGFSDEAPHEILILLMEEVGELARAMRMRLGLTYSQTNRRAKEISLELADCLIYILHLANRSGVRLLAAFREKERINAGKKWVKL